MRLHSLPFLLTLLGLSCAARADGGDAGAWVVAQATAAATSGSSLPAKNVEPAPSEPCRIKVGWDPIEPYAYRSPEGSLQGLDLELVHAILTRAQCDVVYTEGRWTTLLRRLQRGDVDVIPGALRTPARESYALFSAPYRDETIALYVRKGDGTVQRSTSLQALLDTGFKLGVREQYGYGETVESLQEDPHYSDQFVGASNDEQNYQRLVDLEIDGFLEEPIAAHLYIRKKGLQEEVALHPLLIYSGEVALMFSKASVDPAVLARVDTAIAALKADSDYAEIADKYTN
jgi:polar amino acid transport system substrate-binding protein